jgi:threonine/homoserine/homoserine lactone efflux protein
MLLLLSVIWALMDSVWYLLLAWLAGQVRDVFSRPSVRRRLEQVSGVALVALGVRLAVEA